MRPSRPKTPRKPNGKLKSTKDPIEVYCRIRPVEDGEDQVCVRAKDDKTVVLFPPEVSLNSRVIREVHYSFKHVFDETTTQKELFDYVCLPLVQDALLGSNGLLFTYGISSSGKTYTMTGTPQDGGLLLRSLDVIFNSIKDYQAKKFVFKPDKMNGFDVQSPADALADQQKELGIFNRNKPRNRKEAGGDFSSRVPDNTVVTDILPDMCFSVFVSYVEIYNNYIYDLLEDTPVDPKRIKAFNSKMLREDATKNVYVFGVQENEVKTVEEALELIDKGQRMRKVAHTALNTESSRSHCVFTIRIVQAPLDPVGAEVLQVKEKIIVSQLSLVDLAGSERPVRTKNTGYKLKEAGNINSSLMILRNCIEILRESQTQGISKVVPYRESKLTHLFKTFFEGEGKLRMLVCVNPRADNYEETIHVMRFAEITQDVEIARATPISTPVIPGLRVGRGVLYREAIKKAKEQGVPLSEVLPPTVYTLGPEFPQLTIQTYDDESVYINLIEFLAARISKKNSLNEDLDRRQEEFRKNLLATDKEILQLQQEKQILQMDLEAREQQIRGLEQKLCTVEESFDLMQRHVDDYKRKAEKASEEVYEKENMLAEQKREFDRLKLKMQEKIASTKEHMKRKMDEKIAEVKKKMCLTADNLRQLREIINADEWDEYLSDVYRPMTYVPSSTTSEASGPVTRRKRSSAELEELASEARFCKAKARSATDVHSNNASSVPTHSQGSKNDAGVILNKENRPPISTINSRGIVVSNPRHRRSTSTGDIWIEHKPVGNLELNTVLQPAIKKKKSVSKLEVKDVTNSEKYVLQHQEQDSQGEVETQLFKADIIPSAGGGAQVIFNDVEKLRQVSPPPVYNLRKRSGDNLPLKEIEDRCTVSVECHGLPSKVMKKKY